MSRIAFFGQFNHRLLVHTLHRLHEENGGELAL